MTIQIYTNSSKQTDCQAISQIPTFITVTKRRALFSVTSSFLCGFQNCSWRYIGWP